MNESLLNDLQKKIQNTVHDFGLEHDIPGLVDVSVEANRIIVEVKEQSIAVPNESIYPAGEVSNIIIRANTEASGQAASEAFASALRERMSTRDDHLPIESTLTEREQEDIQKRKDKK